MMPSRCVSAGSVPLHQDEELLTVESHVCAGDAHLSEDCKSNVRVEKMISLDLRVRYQTGTSGTES